MQSQDISNLTINKLTQAQYDSITPSDTELYLITDAEFDDELSSTSENAVQNKVIKEALDGKQATISDLTAIRNGASAGATALQSGDDISELTNDAGYITSASIGNGTITIKQGTTTKGTFTVNQGGDTEIALDAPSGITIDSELSSTSENPVQNKIIKSALDNKSNSNHSHTTSDISDFPSNVSSFTNDAGYLTSHQDITGKQDKITATNKLASDLVDDSNSSNKFVSTAEKTTWNGKQDTISDLATIRSGAEAGATALQPNDNISELTNDAGYLTDIPTASDSVKGGIIVGSGLTITNGVLSADAQTITVDSALSSTSENPVQNKVINSALGNKQDTISDISTIRSNATAGASAATTIAGYGDIVTHDASEFLTEHQDISGKANTADLADVATSGDYDDLTNKPIIPTNTNQLTNGAGFITSSALSGYAQSSDLATVATSGSYNDLTDKPTITVNNATLTIQKNSTDVGTFTANQSTDETINIIVPTTAADVSALPSSTKYGASIDMSLNETTYVLTVSLKDQDGTALNSKTVDFPIESAVVGGSYDSTNQKVVLTLKSGATIDVPVGDLISGLQTAITAQNPLDADLVDDSTSTHKFVTASDKTTWNGKQDAISDLSTIRTNATNGASAYTTIQGYGDIVTHDANEFLTEHQSLSGYQTLLNSTNTLNADYITDGTTNKVVTSTEKSTWNGKQDAISDLSDIRSGASAGATALQSGDNVSELVNDAGYLTSVAWGDVTGKPSEYTPASHTQASNTINALTGYTKASTATSLSASDTLNEALGKLEKGLEGKQSSGSYAAQDHTHVSADITDLNIPVVVDSYSSTGTDAISGKGVKAALDTLNIPTVTSSYSSTGTDAVNGTAVATALNGLSIPANTSDLTNDSGFITSSSLPTKLSDLTDDLGTSPVHSHSQYLTSSSISGLATDSLVVHLAGTETITGDKTLSGSTTFSGSVSLGSSATATTPSSSDNSTTVATTAFVKAQGYLAGLSAGNGISVSGNTITNAGVRAVSAGTTNGTISVNTNGTSAEVAVAGLGSAAYTASTAYAASSHNQASNTINALTGYTKASASAALSTSDSLNTALGKLEYKVDNASGGGSITVGQLSGS